MFRSLLVSIFVLLVALPASLATATPNAERVSSHAITTASGPAVAELWIDPETRRGFVRLHGSIGLVSAVMTIWKLDAGDLDGDGIDELLLGVLSRRGSHHPGTRRSIWVIAAEPKGLRPIWRGSKLPDPFEDFGLRRRRGRDFLVTHPTGPGLPSTVYRWTGFGFAADARVERPPMRVTFLGDTAIARYEADGRVAVAPSREARRATESADLVIANLETTVASAPAGAERERPLLQIHADDLDHLRGWGIDAVTRANNHALDNGAGGWKATESALAERGIDDLTDARLHLGGRPVRMIAASLHPPRARPPFPLTRPPHDAIVEAVSRSDETELLIVSLHGGSEGNAGPRMRDRALTRRLVEAGADVVVWHGSHRPARVETIGRSVVAWGLGDFALRRKNTGCALHLSIGHGGIEVVDGPWGCESNLP